MRLTQRSETPRGGSFVPNLEVGKRRAARKTAGATALAPQLCTASHSVSAVLGSASLFYKELESKYFRLCRRSSRSYSTPRIVAKAAMNINEWVWMCSNKTLFKKARSTVVHNGPQFANSCYH